MQAFGVGEVLEPMLSKVANAQPGPEPGPDQPGRRVRQQDLSAVRRIGDPRGAVHVDADIPLAAAVPTARVQAHANTDRRPVGPGVRRERPLRLDRRDHAFHGLTEHREERIAVRADLDAADGRDGPAQDVGMLVERVGIALPDLL